MVGETDVGGYLGQEVPVKEGERREDKRFRGLQGYQ